MPIFEYACRDCGQQFETLVRGADTPACPACSGQDLDRLLSSPAVHSEGTRRLALRAAKKRDKIQGEEQTRAQLEYERNHD